MTTETTEIEATLKKVLSDLNSETSISIKVNPELKDIFDDKIKEMAETNKLYPSIELHYDTNVLLGDCQVAWSSGMAERNSTEVWRQIDDIVEANFPKQLSNKNINSSPPNDPITESIFKSQRKQNSKI